MKFTTKPNALWITILPVQEGEITPKVFALSSRVRFNVHPADIFLVLKGFDKRLSGKWI